MVIGNGMIAKKFGKYAEDTHRLIFASGISNSSSAIDADYKREEELLLQVIKNNSEKTFIYFSTCSIYDPSLKLSRYVTHKLKMEEIIKSRMPSYIIFRVSNPIGMTNNRHTVLNYFIQHIKTQEHFTLWQYASRNLIDMDDVFKLCEHIMQSKQVKNDIVNIANPVNYPVISIIEAIEKHFALKANYSLAEKGNSPFIDTAAIQPLFALLHIEFNQHYLPFLLQKYFPIL
jgi:nucleoside-diphosphate-sugar epimerase